MPGNTYLMSSYVSAIGTKPESVGGGYKESLIVFCYWNDTDGYKLGWQEAMNFNQESGKRWRRMKVHGDGTWSSWIQM